MRKIATVRLVETLTSSASQGNEPISSRTRTASLIRLRRMAAAVSGTAGNWRPGRRSGERPSRGGNAVAAAQGCVAKERGIVLRSPFD